MNNYYWKEEQNRQQNTSSSSYSIVEANKYQQYVTYQIATTEITEENQKVLDKLGDDVELQAQYLRSVEEKQLREEEERKNKEIFEEANRNGELTLSLKWHS